jgi:xylan 1,4-beta-xylosidase
MPQIPSPMNPGEALRNVDYHAAHSPFGAFASFTCGLCFANNGNPAGTTGGFSISSRKPAGQNLFIGYRRGSGAWNLLPFFKPMVDRSADFTAEHVASKKAGEVDVKAIPQDQIRRTLSLASDLFEVGPFTFSLHSHFERIPELGALDPERRKFLLAPVVSAVIAGDNSDSDEAMEIMFGYEDPDSGQRLLSDTHPDLAGFAVGTRHGFAAAQVPGLTLNSGFSLFSKWRRDNRGIFLLGASAAVVCTIPARGRQSVPLALGFFQDGVATTGLESHYLYTKHFSGLEEVLRYGLAHHTGMVKVAKDRDQELLSQKLSPERAWLIAHGVHSYLNSTQLLQHKGRSLWVVNEGEYRMLNTFDLLVDHVFFELAWWPWAVRDTLDLFAKRYSYTDTIHSPDGRTAKGGLSFAHDMGVDNQFTPPGTSSYELPNLTDCFSFMTSEQLTNWVCTAVCYFSSTGDLGWLKKHRGTLKRCAKSLQMRDDPVPRKRNGIIKWDSDYCGPTGSEITTYDALDVSLGQARNNLYLAVKTLGAWLVLEHAFSKLEEPKLQAVASSTGAKLAKAVSGQFEEGAEMFPAVFENGNQSRIIPAIEGLIYPLFVGIKGRLGEVPEYGHLLGQLERHLRKILVRGVCLDAKSGGWKLSSSSTNTWMSKIFLCQHVADELFAGAVTAEASAPADVAHVNWLLSPITRTLNFCDQLHSESGEPLGSRNYPRGVTAWLWVK